MPTHFVRAHSDHSQSSCKVGASRESQPWRRIWRIWQYPQRTFVLPLRCPEEVSRSFQNKLLDRTLLQGLTKIGNIFATSNELSNTDLDSISERRGRIWFPLAALGSNTQLHTTLDCHQTYTGLIVLAETHRQRHHRVLNERGLHGLCKTTDMFGRRTSHKRCVVSTQWGVHFSHLALASALTCRYPSQKSTRTRSGSKPFFLC